MVNEIWKPIEGFETAYEISNLGRVKSLARLKKHWKGGFSSVTEKILKGSINSKGYFNVDLSNGDVFKKSIDIHRLVALHFVKNIENKPFVNHIDGNKQNNRFDNLEWCTPKENMQHAYKTGLNIHGKGEKSRNVKLNDVKVLEIRASLLTNKELAKIYSIHNSMISCIRLRKNWKHI